LKLSVPGSRRMRAGHAQALGCKALLAGPVALAAEICLSLTPWHACQWES
jgi:hypothetical protein